MKAIQGRLPQLASLIVLSVAVLVLIGWQLDISLFKTGSLSGTATMKANTAVGLVLASAAIFTLSRRQNTKPSRAKQLLLAVLATLVCLIGSLTLSQYLFNWDLGIDLLLFADQTNPTTPYPGRMGFNTALSLTLVGAALLFSLGRHLWLGQTLAVAALMVAVQALIGHAYAVQAFYQFSSSTTAVALPTAITFVVLCVGILALHPEQGIMELFTSNLSGSLLARRLLPTAVIFPLLLGWLIVWGYRAQYYEPEYGISLLVVLLVIGQTALIGQSIWLLNRNEIKRRKLEAIHQQAEVDLQESESRLRQITESINAVFWMTDPRTAACLYISPKYEQIWGRSREAVQANWRSWIEAIHPDDRQRVEQAFFTEALQGTYDQEFRIIQPDGSIRWVRDRGYPVYSEGVIKCASGLAEDITAQKQVELERDRFFSLSLDLLCIAGLDGYFKRLNPAFEQTLGHTEAELLSQPFLEFVHPDDRAATLAALQQLTRGESVTHFENRYRCKDGSYRWLDWVTAPVPEEGILYAVAHDVTQRKQVMDAVKQLNQNLSYRVKELETLLELIPIGIGIAEDPECRKIRVNSNFAKHLGISHQENASLSTSFSALANEKPNSFKVYQNGQELAPEALPMQYAATHGVEVRDFEVDLVHDSGKVVRLLEYAAPLLNEQGQTMGCIGAFLDITERVQTEAKIREFSEGLEQRVKERTAQLEAANRELESFSYSVSHDLRAPLRHIAGFVDLLQKRLDANSLDATSQRYLNIIAETTHQAGTLIDDLLSFSRMGRTEMRWMLVDMNQLVLELQRELELDLSQRQINWQIETLPVVQGDPSMLRLVMRNLLDNAVKYTRECHPTRIRIGSTPTEEEDVIFVRDNGIGFNMQYAHKLFGIFQRLHSNPNFEGTGIGLANVRRIIHRHGGRTWAEATLNGGATFYFSLPKLALEQRVLP